MTFRFKKTFKSYNFKYYKWRAFNYTIFFCLCVLLLFSSSQLPVSSQLLFPNLKQQFKQTIALGGEPIKPIPLTINLNYNITGKERDRYVFKVPSLRNVVLTPSYFHDGTTETLQQAVIVMGKYQLGINLSPEDTESIIQFLNTLTGEYKGNPL